MPTETIAQYEHCPVSDFVDFGGGHPIAMLSGYIDDSADEKRERFAAYGGVLGRKQQMECFELLWIHDTRRLTEPFRSTDCESGNKQFESWPLPDRVGLMKDLVSRIKEQNVWSYGTTVSIQDYRARFGNSSIHGPAILCATSALIALGALAKSINEKIAIWVESGDIDGEILQTFKRLKAVKPWPGQNELYSIAFGDKKLVPLQAADLMAREAFKHFDNEGIRPMRKPLVRLSKQMMLNKWRPDGLDYIAAQGYPDHLDEFAYAFASGILKP